MPFVNRMREGAAAAAAAAGGAQLAAPIRSAGFSRKKATQIFKRAPDVLTEEAAAATARD